jgi:protein TonB
MSARAVITLLIGVFVVALPALAQQQADEPIYKLGPGITPPRVTHQVAPEHPTKGFRVTGSVEISIVVTSGGAVRDPQVTKSLTAEVDQAAVDAVKQWTFAPARKDNQTVAVRVTVEIRFHDM